jgi:hypothetical protein
MTRTRSYVLGLAALVVATVALGWLGKSMIDDQPLGVVPFWHEGYFRADTGDRLFTIGYLPTVSEPDIVEYARQLTYTPGRTTIAFFYPEGSRIPGATVTSAPSLAQARQAMSTATGASPWRYAAVHDERGEVRLVDCLSASGDPLCGF